MKFAFFYFIESALTEMSACSFLNKMFGRNLERWTLALSSIGVLIQHASKYTRLVRPLAKFIRTNMKYYVDETKRKAWMIDDPWTLTKSLAASLKSSVDDNHSNHARHHRAKEKKHLIKTKVTELIWMWIKANFHSYLKAWWILSLRQAWAENTHCQIYQGSIYS